VPENCDLGVVRWWKNFDDKLNHFVTYWIVIDISTHTFWQQIPCLCMASHGS